MDAKTKVKRYGTKRNSQGMHSRSQNNCTRYKAKNKSCFKNSRYYYNFSDYDNTDDDDNDESTSERSSRFQ